MSAPTTTKEISFGMQRFGKCTPLLTIGEMIDTKMIERFIITTVALNKWRTLPVVRCGRSAYLSVLSAAPSPRQPFQEYTESYSNHKRNDNPHSRPPN